MNELRSLWMLDEDFVFLNHGSFGACPRAVLEAQDAIRARLESQPVRFMVRELEAASAEVREKLSSFIGADAEGMAYVPNATSGVNAVLQSLALEPGDELLTTSHAYNACRNVLDFVAERSGAKVVSVEIPFPISGPEEVRERIAAAVTERTRIALLDQITSPTALILPMAEICADLRARGVLSLVDGAHALVTLDLDLERIGCDFHTSNAHKWLCAPKGAAYLWVRPEHRSWVRPAVISHGANAPTELRSRYRQEFDWTGTQDFSAWLSVPSALDFMTGLFPSGIEELRRRNHELALAGRELILDALGAEAPCPESMLGCMATVPLPPDPDDAPTGHSWVGKLQNALYEQYRIEVPVLNFPSVDQRWLRISAQAYNDIEDYRVLARALVELLDN